MHSEGLCIVRDILEEFPKVIFLHCELIVFTADGTLFQTTYRLHGSIIIIKIIIIPSFMVYGHNSRGQLFCNLPAKINHVTDVICRSSTRFQTLAVIFRYILTR